MAKWEFPSRGYAETEGFSNAGLAEFRGNPLQALAREICQNSLDAADGSGRPVRVEFHKHFMEINSFPGMIQLRSILDSCERFWGREGDANTKAFLRNAQRHLGNSKSFTVLQVSDYNTKGVQGAFSSNNITPWGSLVKGNAFSVKSDESNAAGSYGIGKAAPFVSSAFQTVFYRTYDIDNERAALGVARLMAFNAAANEVKPGEDPVRRSVGYYGVSNNNKPSVRINELDNINERTEHGTDLFIPGFMYSTADNEWVKTILLEVVDNFLYSIYTGKLEVIVEDTRLNRESLPTVLSRLGPKAKNAIMFLDVIREDNQQVHEVTRPFYKLGTLRLRLMYEHDLSKKVLVVRKSGMRIARIPSLPRGISYVGFLELQGEKLNQFFRNMENPKHNAWEPKRHENSELARRYKEEVEDWVRTKISEKLIEISGEESVIDIGDCFNYQDRLPEENKDERKKERIVDTVKSIEVIADTPTEQRKFKITDIGGNTGTSRNADRSGTIDDVGGRKGHRTRTGTKKGGAPTGRSGREDSAGKDRIYDGKHEVYVSARIISRGNGDNLLIYKTEEDIEFGEMEIVTKGENGKVMQLYVIECNGDRTRAEEGHIVITGVKAGVKNTAEFKIAGKRSFAMGVKAYGN